MNGEIPEIFVTRFSLDDEDVVPLSLAESWLNREERARADRFRFDVHRARYLRGRAMVRALLARRLGVAPASLEFESGPWGKPALRDNSLFFNLSHSEDLAAVALGEVPGIGVDIERCDRPVDHDALARRCFRPVEIDWMNSVSPAERARAFFRIWTAKEARMKATGEGFQLSPQRIELEFAGDLPVRLLEPRDPRAHLAVVDPAEPSSCCSVVALAPFRLMI